MKENVVTDFKPPFTTAKVPSLEIHTIAQCTTIVDMKLAIMSDQKATKYPDSVFYDPKIPHDQARS